jgi:hypothetical protein
VPPSLLGLTHEALHRANLRERLVRRPHRLGDAVLDAGARPPQPPAEDKRRADDERDHGERGRRQARVRERQQHDAADEEERLSGELRDPAADQRLQHREVRREAAGELAGATLDEERG